MDPARPLCYNTNTSPVGFNDLFHIPETESRSFFLIAEKWIEHIRQIFLGNAGAVVIDLYFNLLHALRGIFCGYPDPSILGNCIDRILQHIDYSLFDLVPVNEYIGDRP